LAAELSETTWQTTPELEIVPYIDGTPAGTPRRAEVVWLDKVLYVERLPNAKLARLVPERLGRIFGRPDITAALNYCFGRSPEDVTEYIEENFKLAPQDVVATPVDEAAAPTGEHTATDTSASLSPSSEETPTDHEVVATNDEVNGESVTQPGGKGEPAKEEEKPDELDGLEVPPQKTRPLPKQTKPSIIERFARSQGFQKDGEDRFFHDNGSFIAKAKGDRFLWERRTSTGEIIRYYWPKDHCLEHEPLQLEADVWGLLGNFPDKYALVLSNPKGEPVELLGARLLSMRAKGELTLYPATYRLVIGNEHEQ
jgi:hypothetical protein